MPSIYQQRISRYRPDGSGVRESVYICGFPRNVSQPGGNVCSLPVDHDGPHAAYSGHETHSRDYLMATWDNQDASARTSECMACRFCNGCIPAPMTGSLVEHGHVLCTCGASHGIISPWDPAHYLARLYTENPGFLPADISLVNSGIMHTAAQCNALAADRRYVCTRPLGHEELVDVLHSELHAAHTDANCLVRRWPVRAGEERRQPLCARCRREGNICTNPDCMRRSVCRACCIHGRAQLREQTMKFIGEPSKLYPRYVGVEVECGKIAGAKVEGYNNSNACADKWGFRIGSDGSLRAFQSSVEFSTTPARGNKFNDQITDLAKAIALDELKANSSCGLHVHVDVRDYTIEHLLNLVYVYSKVEKAMYKLIAPSRRTNQYCKPWNKAFQDVNDKRHGLQQREKYLDVAVYGSVASANEHRNGRRKSTGRYRGMNLNAIAVHGTIEFRMHHGTVNEQKIKNWSAICSALVEWAFRHTEEEARALKGPASNILEKIVDNEEVNAWSRARRLMFLNMSRKNHGVARKIGEKPVPIPLARRRHVDPGPVELSEDPTMDVG